MKKRKLKIYLKLGILLFGISILLWNCEKNPTENLSSQDKSSSKFVNVNDIPQVISFIKSKTNNELKFTLKNPTSSNLQNKNHEDNITIGTVLTNKIKQLTSSYGKSNYTFVLQKPKEDKNEPYFMNLVVKEYKESLYAFIAKYVPDQNWLSNSFVDESSLESFTGVIYMYNQQGLYAGKIKMSNGVSTRTEYSDPCSDGETDTDNYDGNSDYDQSDTDDSGSDSGGGSDYGGGSSNCEWVLFYDSIGNTVVLLVCGDDLLNLRTGNPCDPNTDSELGSDTTNGSNENPNNGVLLDDGFMIPSAIRNINNCLSNGITPEQSSWLSDSNNYDATFALNDYISSNNCSLNAQNFGELALNAEMNDGEVDYEYQIINEFKEKVLCVYNKLKSSSTGFSNAIKKFEPDFPVAHLKFEGVPLSGTQKGRTIAPNNNPLTPNSPDYVITVQINNANNIYSYQKRPNLLVAKTIAHEVIHAEMFRKLLSVLDNGGTISGVTRQDVLDALDGNFPGMYDYYFRHHKNWQHQQMATHYRETLGRILQEFDTGIAVSDNQQPQQLYMDLAWEGLIYENGTSAIYTWTSLPQTERDRIEDVIEDYINDNLNENCTE